MQIDLPGQTVLQIDCHAYKSPGDVVEDGTAMKSTMHVQSISHWAPANIGPYSQATRVR